MLAVQRRSATLDLLARQDVVTVETLAALLRVSLSTIRRDLHDLEQQGILRRVHGGAVLTRPGGPPDAPELPPAEREIERRAEKSAIAKAAVRLIDAGSALLLTGGTTTAALIPLLSSVPGVRVVTNSLDVAHRLADGDVDLVVLGGALRRPELSLLGHLAAANLAELHVDHAIMGVYGIDPRSGILGASAQECETDRSLARCAARLTILADASKFARRSPHRIAPVERMTELITSADAPAEDVAALRAQGVDVLIA